MTKTTVLVGATLFRDVVSISQLEWHIKYYLNRRVDNSYDDEQRKASRKLVRTHIKALRLARLYNEMVVEAQKTTIEHVGTNLVTDDLDMANEIIQKHDDYNNRHIDSTMSVARERAFISETYKVEFSKIDNYYEFIARLIDEVRINGCKKYPIITFKEFCDKKMENGQKVGRYLSRCGIDNNFIGNLDGYMSVEGKTVYATISGATQDIIGMSYFLNGNSSCQNWDDCSDIGYALHNLAGSQCKEQYVFYLHNSLDDLEHDINNEHMLSRTTVLRVEESGIPVYYHGRMYGKTGLHNEVLKEFKALGHFSSYSNSDYGKQVNYELKGGNRLNVSGDDVHTWTLGGYENTTESVDCPRCQGDEYMDVCVYDENGNHKGEISVPCPVCEGHGHIDIDVCYDFDGESATDYEDVDTLEEMADVKRVFKFYNGHAFEGFRDNGRYVTVYAIERELNEYVTNKLYEESNGKMFLQAKERAEIIQQISENIDLLDDAPQLAQLDSLEDMALVTMLVAIHGLTAIKKHAKAFELFKQARQAQKVA